MELENGQEENKQVYKNSQESFEEISEKKTSKLGYVLLILMVFFVISVGETIFSDLKRIPTTPISPSYCIQSTINNLQTITTINCPSYRGFNETDLHFSLDSDFLRILPTLQTVANYNKTISSNKSGISTSEKQIQRLNSDYDLSLQEKMAGENAIMNTFSIKNEIENLRLSISKLSSSNSLLTRQRDSAISKLSSSVTEINSTFLGAQEYYQDNKSWYKFKVFFLTLLFVLPFFLTSLYLYLKLKRKNSPYTIILTASTTAFSILFLQVVITFLFEILPMGWFMEIFSLFFEVPFLRYIIYYGSVILVILLFGGVVYYIQKRVFSPNKVAIRRIKDKKCPGCSFPIEYNQVFCPDCGLQLKERCSSCDGARVRYLPHCPDCGK